jgi:hypothetical protein
MRAHEQLPQYQTPHVVEYHVRHHAEQEEKMSERIGRLIKKATEVSENMMDDEDLDDLL